MKQSFFIFCYACLLKDHTHLQCRRILVPGHRLKCMTGRKSAVTLQFWHWPLFGEVQHMQQFRGKDFSTGSSEGKVLRRVRGDLWLFGVLNEQSI